MMYYSVPSTITSTGGKLPVLHLLRMYFIWSYVLRGLTPRNACFFPWKHSRAAAKKMSKAGAKRALGGDDSEKSPFTDEQLAALDDTHKSSYHQARDTLLPPTPVWTCSIGLTNFFPLCVFSQLFSASS